MKIMLLAIAVLGLTKLVNAEAISLDLPPKAYLVAEASADQSADLSAPAPIVNAPAPVAKKYFRFIGDGPLQKSAGALIYPKVPLSTALGVDVGIITHSKEDGSICSKWNLGSWCVPENWVPLQIGAYGSIDTDFVLAPGTSANLAPQVAALTLGWASKESNPWAYAVRTALDGSGSTSVRLGAVLAPKLVKGGTWQSAKEMFPGRGPLDIIGNLAAVNVGLAW